MKTRTKWIIISAEILIIYSTLYIIRTVTTFLDERGILPLTIYIIAALFFSVLIVYLLKQNIPLLNIILLLPLLSAFGFLFMKMEIIVERIHLMEYGLLGFMLTSAFSDKLRKLHSLVTAFFIATLVGYIDELIQYFLPNRVYDIRDVIFNTVAGLFGITAFIILKWINVDNFRQLFSQRF